MSHPPISPSPNSNSSPGVRMTNEELLSRRSNWTLACDNALLNRLRDFSENLETSARELSANCDALSNDVSTLQFKISNITNEFLMLADTRFVENRVQEFEECSVVDKNPPKQVIVLSKAEKEAALIEKMKESIQIGVSIQQEKDKVRSLNLEDSLNTSTDSRFTSSVNLAHLIGSSKFFSSKYCGLVNENRLGYGTNGTTTITDNSIATSSTSSSSHVDDMTANKNDSEKLIFPDFEPTDTGDIFEPASRTQSILEPSVLSAPVTSHMYADYPKVLPEIGNTKSGSESEPSTNFVAPRPPPFPGSESSRVVPPRPPSTPSPTSSTSSSFFESNSAAPSGVTNLFSNQPSATHIARPIAVTPPETPEPDYRPPPILDVSDSDDDDIFSSSKNTTAQKSSAIYSHFSNQSVPSYAYNQNIFDQPPPARAPITTAPPISTVDTNKNQSKREELISNVGDSSEVKASRSQANPSSILKSQSVPKVVENENDIFASNQAKIVPQPKSEIKPEPVKMPQQYRPDPPPFRLPQIPKQTSIFDDSDSDDDLFSNISSKPSKIQSSFKSAPPVVSESQNQSVRSHTYNSSPSSGFNFNSDSRPPPILDLSGNESESEDDDIFKSLGKSSKLGFNKNDNNDSFLSRISPPLPVSETIRDTSGGLTTNVYDAESPVISVPVQNQTSKLKGPETILESATSISQPYSNANTESHFIPINVNDSSPSGSGYSVSQSQGQPAQKELKTETVKQLPVMSTKIITTPKRDFFNPTEKDSHDHGYEHGSKNKLIDALDTGNSKVVITDTDLPQPSFGSVWVPPTQARPPSPTSSTEDETNSDIFTSHQSNVKSEITKTETKVPTVNATITSIEPELVPVQVPVHVPVQTPIHVPVQVPIPEVKLEAKPKFQSQNVGRLKSKSIFDSSDSDDDLFSTKPKSFTSSPSVKDVSPQPKPKDSIFGKEPPLFLEQPPPTLEPSSLESNLRTEPPPFLNHNQPQEKSKPNQMQRELDQEDTVLRRPPPILDLSDEDSDEDLFKSMSKSQTQISWQQPEIKIIGGASTSSQHAMPIQAPDSTAFIDPSLSASGHGHPHGILEDRVNSKSDSNSSAVEPNTVMIKSSSSVSVPTDIYPGQKSSNYVAKISSDIIPETRSSQLRKEKSIFESSDSDDDLFSTKSKTVITKSIKSVSTPTSLTAPASTPFAKSPVSLARQSSPKDNTTAKIDHKNPAKLSLFDDSDDDDASDLFKGSHNHNNKAKGYLTVLDADSANPPVVDSGSRGGSVTPTVPDNTCDNIVSQDIIKSNPSTTLDTTDFKKKLALKPKSARSGSVTGNGTPGMGLDGHNPRDKIFGAVAKSLENIFSAKNIVKTGNCKTTLSSNFCDSVSFDENASTENLLHCVTKDRPKISHPRRPPSLKRRQYSKSTSSLHNMPNADTNELDPLV